MNLTFLNYQHSVCLKYYLDNYREKIKKCKYFFGLFFLNILTHYLFISRYTFVSDDWTEIVYSVFSQQSFYHLLLESQRPILYIFFKIANASFGSNPFAYQVLNLITTSLIIFLVFLIAESLLNTVYQDSTIHAFLVAFFFCVIINIDQLFTWGLSFSNNLAIILYLGSFYYYINLNRKQYYLFLSVLLFLIAIFTYEIGVFFPIIFISYDVLFHRNWKKSLWYILPLGFWGIVRETNLFDFGWIFINRQQNWLSLNFLQEFCQNFFINNVIREIGRTGLNTLYGIIGLSYINYMVFFILIIIDFVCILLIFRYLILPVNSENNEDINFKNAVKISYIGIFGILLSHLILSVNGGSVSTRHLIFIDFFIILSIVALVGPHLTKKPVIIPLFCIILTCILINQGLSVNWIIAGNICTSVNQSISENANDISLSDYVFINGVDLTRAIPTSMLKYNFKNGDFNEYLNSPCLPYWAVNSMVSGTGINTSEVHIIYDNSVDGSPITVVFSANNSIMYQDIKTKAYNTINKSEYFELNSTNLFSAYFNKEHSDFLFRQKTIHYLRIF